MDGFKIPTSTYPIGTQFKKVGRKNQATWTVTECLLTYTISGKIMKIRYIAIRAGIGQIITDYDVVPTTIARGIVNAITKID